MQKSITANGTTIDMTGTDKQVQLECNGIYISASLETIVKVVSDHIKNDINTERYNTNK